MNKRTRMLWKRWCVLAPMLGIMLMLGGCFEPDGFTIADTNGDGWISPDEFERFMLEAIFTEADANGDARVTFAEWREANPSAEAHKFRAPDRNGDAAVDPGELRRHFARYGTMMELFVQIDTDANGYLSRKEVAAFKKKVDAQAGATGLERLSQAAAGGASS